MQLKQDLAVVSCKGDQTEILVNLGPGATGMKIHLGGGATVGWHEENIKTKKKKKTRKEKKSGTDNENRLQERKTK